jgi:5'-deoxynucleotidase YfbR-like HD superfamily hydrolase
MRAQLAFGVRSGMSIPASRSDITAILTRNRHVSNAMRQIPPTRAWQRMLSGRRLDLLDPSPLDVEIDDIAHGLARVARWNGQTTGEHAFSVAQHCVVVEEILRRTKPGIEARWRLAALLHDASEYVIGDMISPFKAALGIDYHLFEDRLERAIHVRFGLPPKLPAEVKRQIKTADRICAAFEAVELAGFSTQEALAIWGKPPKIPRPRLTPWSAPEAQARYLERFERLMRAAPRHSAPAATG